MERVVQVFSCFASSSLFRICLMFIRKVALNEHMCSITIVFTLALCSVLCFCYFNFLYKPCSEQGLESAALSTELAKSKEVAPVPITLLLLLVF